jgi:hypothetical protein
MEREGLKGKIAGMEERNNELSRQITKIEESKQGLMTRINQVNLGLETLDPDTPQSLLPYLSSPLRPSHAQPHVNTIPQE